MLAAVVCGITKRSAALHTVLQRTQTVTIRDRAQPSALGHLAGIVDRKFGDVLAVPVASVGTELGHEASVRPEEQRMARDALIDSYLDAVERFDAVAIRACLHQHVTATLHPNAFAPEGSTSGLDAMLAALEAGRGLLREQRFETRAYMELVDGTVLATMTWTGTTAVDMPGIATGTTLRADVASRLTFEGDLILRQENWDCYYPPQAPPPSQPTP